MNVPLQPDVSVIIVNLNTRALLDACLESVCKAVAEATMEVIVIDNGSTDGSVELVREQYPNVHVQVNQMNEGFAQPNNDGMHLAKGRYLFLLNSDAELRPGAIRRLVQFMDERPEVGACGPRLVYPDGRQQRSVRGFPSLWTHVCDMFLLDAVFSGSPLFGRGEMAYFDYSNTAAVDHTMAAAFLVRREILETVGDLDERFSIYYNDMDWCYRIVRQGWQIFYVHDAVVIHHLGSTVNERNRNFGVFEELYDNTMLFFQKRYGRWAVPVYKILLAVGFSFRVVCWGIAYMLRPSDHTRERVRYSWLSFKLGVRFWRPLPYGNEETRK